LNELRRKLDCEERQVGYAAAGTSFSPETSTAADGFGAVTATNLLPRLFSEDESKFELLKSRHGGEVLINKLLIIWLLF
jgi:hypothetical protein